MLFPTIYKVLQDGYDVEMDDGSQVDRADSGKLWVRRLYNLDHYVITFRVGFLSGQDVENIRNFYRSYRNEPIEWQDPYTGVMYDVIMTSPPQHVHTDGLLGIVEVYMEGTVKNA